MWLTVFHSWQTLPYATMFRFNRRRRCRRRLVACFARSCVDIFCSIWLVTHLCSAGPGQASRRARGPVPECFEICWTRHLDVAFKPCGAGIWQTSCWMNLVSQRGSAWWSGWKQRTKWATPAQCCWTRSLAAFRGLELGSWVSLPSRVMAVQSRFLFLWACHIQELGFVQ